MSTMDARAIKSLSNNIEKAVRDKLPASHVKDIMIQLKDNVVATEQVLRETKIGMTVNKLRGYPDKEVADMAKEIVLKWKKDVAHNKPKPSDAKSSTPSSASSSQPAVPKKDATSQNNGTTSSSTSSSRRPTVSPANRKKETDGVSWEIFEDEVRSKSLGLLYDGLCLDSEEPPDYILGIAKALENVIYKTTGSKTGDPYRKKVRSLFLNLRDAKNPSLRKRVVSKEITVERLATMTSEEMASQELKAEIKEMQKENMKEAEVPKGEKATTDQFQCGKCKKRKVSYSQAQTRSADEPMTTFCECEVCGHRWKFS